MANAYHVAAQAYYEKTVVEYATKVLGDPEAAAQAPKWDELNAVEQGSWIEQVAEIIDALLKTGLIPEMEID